MSESLAPGEPRLSDAAVEEADGARNRKLLLGLAGLGGAVVLSLGAYLLLFSGSDQTDDAAAVPSHSTGRPAPAAKADKPLEVVPQTFKGNIGHDPFEPLVEEAVATGGGPGGGAEPTPEPTTPAPAPTSTVVVVPPPPLPTPTPTSTTTTTPTPTSQPGPVDIRLVSVADDNSQAKTKVDGRSYVVKVQDEFATRFKLLRLENGFCGSFQYGDEKFDLCEGESARM